MLFNSFAFVFVFLPAVVTVYYLVPELRARLLWIVVASYVFYAYAAWWYPMLMAGSTAISFAGGRVVAARRSKLVVGATVALLLLLLGAFKYAAFLGGNSVSALSVILDRGFPSVHDFLNGIALPIGISFYTFEGISYVVDVYRGQQERETSLLRYAYFIAFFPHLIAGPIVRYRQLQPQLLRLQPFDADRVRDGLLLFSVGLAKKTVIADTFARKVDRYLADPSQLGFFTGWVGDPRLRLPDLLRLQRVLGHGARARPHARDRAAVELRPPLQRREPDRVLAALARDALDVAPRLRLHPARRQPPRRAAS